jgi:hypothetical protein
MTNSSDTTDQQKNVKKRYHQWSIMIVGTHGRVIPLQRFLPVAVVVSILVVLGILTIVGLSVLYGRQAKQMLALQARMEMLDEKAEGLRHERDVYLAKVVIVQEQLDNLVALQPMEEDRGNDTSDDVAGRIKDDGPSVTPAVVDSTVKAPDKKAVAALPTVAWGATTKDFSVDYDLQTKSLRVVFRIYNASTPKEILSGRCVVVIKQKDDPPVKWISLPSVLLTDGNPAGDTGYAFRIKNYRTIRLTTRNQEEPVEFNTATIYIYHSDGTRLYHKDYTFSIAPVTPPKPQPAVVKERDVQAQSAPETAPQNDGSADPSPAPAEPSSQASPAPVGPQLIESSTIDPLAPNESTGTILEGEEQ